MNGRTCPCLAYECMHVYELKRNLVEELDAILFKTYGSEQLDLGVRVISHLDNFCLI